MSAGQKPYTEKPYKVVAEQYDATASPLQEGVCTCTVIWPDGRAHVHTGGPTMGAELGPTDWIVQDWTARWMVLPDAEFQARFIGGPGVALTPVG